MPHYPIFHGACQISGCTKNNQLSSLSELKNKINKANYQELQQYQYGNAQGFIKTFRAWLGNDGKMHEESNDYRF